jgi:hypothetical protein
MDFSGSALWDINDRGRASPHLSLSIIGCLEYWLNIMEFAVDGQPEVSRTAHHFKGC